MYTLRDLTRFAQTALVQEAVVLPHGRMSVDILRSYITGVGVSNNNPRRGTDNAQKREHATGSRKYESRRQISERGDLRSKTKNSNQVAHNCGDCSINAMLVNSDCKSAGTRTVANEQ